jgi:MOSC domain-containing protein YiiM
VGSLLSVNLADLRTLERGGKPVSTGIWKLPAAGRVHAGPEGLEGDVQADRSVHGGIDQALYAYAREDLDWWEGEVGRPLEAGAFGENLTLAGIDASGATVGERWRLGGVLAEVTSPRIPCWKLATKMGDPRFIKTFARARRMGAYLRVIEPGELGAGDAVERLSSPDHGVTVKLVADALLGDHSLAPRLLEAPELAADVRDWAAARVAA